MPSTAPPGGRGWKRCRVPSLTGRTGGHSRWAGRSSRAGTPPGWPGAERFFPACDLAAQHVDDDEVVGQYRAEQIMISGEQGGEEGFIAREDLAGVDVVCRFHGSPPDDQPVSAGAVRRAAAVGPRGFRPAAISAVAAGDLTPMPTKG
jgi:hypothetical protein